MSNPANHTPEEQMKHKEARISKLEQQLYWAQLKIQKLEELLRQQRIARFGVRSEKLSDLQLALLDEEPSVTADEVSAEAEREGLPGTGALPVGDPQQPERAKHPGRQRLPLHLPRREETIACPAEACTCKHCGQQTAVIGYDESEQLDVEPAKYFVRVIKREKRACRHCEKRSVVAAPLPDRIVEKGLASDRIVVDTVIQKYCDHRVPRTWRQQCRCGAVEEMRVGPSKPEIRIRLQTTANCCR